MQQDPSKRCLGWVVSGYGRSQPGEGGRSAAKWYPTERFVEYCDGAWGWSILYQGDYGLTGLSISSVFGGAQQYLMLGAIDRSNPGVITVMAGALTTDVLQVTNFNTTHTANGVDWYYNGSSMGFTPVGKASPRIRRIQMTLQASAEPALAGLMIQL